MTEYQVSPGIGRRFYSSTTRFFAMHPTSVYLSALARQAELEIELNSDGSATLAIDGRPILIQWSEARQAFIIYAEIGQLPGVRDSDILRHLLSANFLFADSLGGALALDEPARTVGIGFTVPVYGLDADGFLKVFEGILAAAEIWKKKFRAMCADAEETALKAAAAVAEGAAADEEPMPEYGQFSSSFIRV